MAHSSNKGKRTPEELLAAIERLADDVDEERVATMSEDELDRELRDLGADPEAVGRRGEALARRLARSDDAPPMRLAAGLPRRQAFLAILGEAARDARHKALLDAELGARKLEELGDDELERLVRKVRGTST